MTREERNRADRILLTWWDRAVGARGYVKKDFNLVQRAIWSNPEADGRMRNEKACTSMRGTS